MVTCGVLGTEQRTRQSWGADSWKGRELRGLPRRERVWVGGGGGLRPLGCGASHVMWWFQQRAQPLQMPGDRRRRGRDEASGSRSGRLMGHPRE